MRGKDYTGMKHGRLTAIERTDRKTSSRSWIWKFKCDCGGETEARVIDVIKGHTKSCGCLQKEKVRETKIKHGREGTRLYRIWSNMKNRCMNKKNPRYEDYGGRGIKVFTDWIEFKNFHAWAINNGYEDHLTIERIDNDKDYEPSNCKWITLQKQQSNRRNTKVYEFAGEKFTAKELSKLTGVSVDALRSRRMRGQELLTKQEYDTICKSL